MYLLPYVSCMFVFKELKKNLLIHEGQKKLLCALLFKLYS
jgi:hypothetical protein